MSKKRFMGAWYTPKSPVNQSPIMGVGPSIMGELARINFALALFKIIKADRLRQIGKLCLAA